MANSIVTWQGGRFTPAFRDSQVEVAQKVPGFRLTQGGFNGNKVTASAGTHGGDSADYSVLGKTREQVTAFIAAQRVCGNAAFFRTTRLGKWGTRAHGFSSYHIHVVPNGYGAPSSGAAKQAAAYRNQRDGLAGNGADSGPGHTGAYRKRTWFDYKASTTTAKPSLPSTGSNQPGSLAVDGKMGPATIRGIQRYVGATQDGVWSPTASTVSPTTKSLQIKLNSYGNKLTVDGKLGPATIKLLQSHVGAVQDGVWTPNARISSPTTAKFQAQINRTFYTSAPVAPKPVAPKPVPVKPKVIPFNSDQVIKAYNNPMKYVSGNLSIVQKLLGITADGKWGPATQEAYNLARWRAGYRGNDYKGAPGKASLQKILGSGYKVI